MSHSSAKQLALWLAILVLTIAFLGFPPVQRTQEARVLETAREMLASGGEQWLIPRLNDDIRLEKPPLAYWLSAAAFRVGGVNESAGRVPMAIAGWATLLITFAAGRSLFGRRAGWLAVAALLGGMMFARHARLAETDVLATFFVTAAILCIWRGWFALSGVMIGLALMSKGLPAVFAILFLIALAAADRDWRLLWRWTRSGAPLLALIIGSWWYVFIIWKIGWETFRRELRAGVEGSTHAASFLQYFPDLLRAVAPWSALAVLALVLACFHWRDDRRLRTLLIWFAAVFIPVLIAGQRQFHYLLPALPPLAILTAWLLDDAIRGTSPHVRLVTLLVVISSAASALAAWGVPVIAWKVRGWIAPSDWAMCVLIFVAGVATVLLSIRSLSRGVLAFAFANVLVMTLLLQWWAPSLRPDNARAVAAGIRHAGMGPYCFYGENASMPLLFYLRSTAPRVTTPDALTNLAAQRTGLIVVAQSKNDRVPPAPPREFDRVTTIESDDQKFDIYRLGDKKISPPH